MKLKVGDKVLVTAEMYSGKGPARVTYVTENGSGAMVDMTAYGESDEAFFLTRYLIPAKTLQPEPRVGDVWLTPGRERHTIVGVDDGTVWTRRLDEVYYGPHRADDIRKLWRKES